MTKVSMHVLFIRVCLYLVGKTLGYVRRHTKSKSNEIQKIVEAKCKYVCFITSSLLLGFNLHTQITPANTTTDGGLHANR